MTSSGPTVIITIKAGGLAEAYCQDPNVELILVDYDEIEGGASAVVIPEKFEAMSESTQKLAMDALVRPR